MTTFAIQANYKWGPARAEHMLNIQGDSTEEFEMNLEWTRENIQDIVAVGDLLGAASVVTTTMGSSGPIATASPAQPASSNDGGVEEVTDKWGKRYVYGLPDAPDLPDGRGKYILKYVQLKDKSTKKVWVDPAEGPKPCKPGEEKAKQIWVND